MRCEAHRPPPTCTRLAASSSVDGQGRSTSTRRQSSRCLARSHFLTTFIAMPRAKRKSTGVKVESEAADPILQHHDPSSSSSATTSNLDATASHLAGYYVPAVAPSDVSTSGDEDDEAWMTNDASGEQDATGPTNQHQQHGGAQSDDDDDDEGAGGAASSGAKNKKEATCRWNDCGHIFADMIKFIDHLHNSGYKSRAPLSCIST